MADENLEESSNDIAPAEICFCIFPHLKEFLVIDVRENAVGGALVHRFSTDDVFDEQFYRELEDSFAAFIRHHDEPFVSFMTLSERVECFTREFGMEAMLRALNDHSPVVRAPQVALLVFIGPLLQADDAELREVFDQLLPLDIQDAFIRKVLQESKQLQAQERDITTRQQAATVQQDLFTDSANFHTIWQRSSE